MKPRVRLAKTDLEFKVDTIKREDMVFRKHYRPSPAILSIFSMLDGAGEEEVKRLVFKDLATAMRVSTAIKRHIAKTNIPVGTSFSKTSFTVYIYNLSEEEASDKKN